MVRYMLSVLLVGALVLGGVAFAEQAQKATAQDPDLARAIHYDANWAVRNGELYKFDAERQAWTSGKAAKGFVIDTLLYFKAEQSWNDEIQPAQWSTIDNTVITDTLWHWDTFNAISGEHSMWWGDPAINGYYSERYERLHVPKIFLDAGYDSVFMVYKQYVRCEEQHGSLIFEGWDGYNVRIDTSGTGDFFEIEPYRVGTNSSFYKSPPDNNNEWNVLRCWERHGEQFGPYTPPYGKYIGGFANDGTGLGGTETIVSKVYDLRPYAIDDSVEIVFVGGSDWGFCTLDDTTLFGYLIDDVMIMEGLDSAKIANLDLTGTTIFSEDFEAGDPGWVVDIPGVPTGNWWHFQFGGHSGTYCVHCGDEFSREYPENCENAIRSPMLADSLFSENLGGLDLMWYLKGLTEDDHSSAYNQYKLDDGQWYQVSVLTHPLGTSYVYSLGGVTDADWWNVDQWSDFMHNMSPLVTDSLIRASWDSLQVQIGFSSDAGWDTVGTIGLQVDDVTLAGRVAAPYDIAASAIKIPGPNANNVAITIDSVAVTNWGLNPASAGVYQIYMAIYDSTAPIPQIVFGPKPVALFPTPTVAPLQTKMVALFADSSTFTMTQEMPYDIKLWTSWGLDTEVWNDTLKTEYTAKADYYPGFYNYPAGQGQIRYHDQGFYNYPYINIRTMAEGEIAATHFTPEERFYPFDLRLGLPEIKGIGETYNFKVWGSGNTPDEAPLLYTVPFTTTSGDTLKYWRMELDTIAALQHMSSDFWMGVEFPDSTDDYVMGTESAENDQLGRNWDHSWLYTVEDGWDNYDYDWMITAVISFRTVDAEAIVSQSGPPSKNSSGNLYLDWVNVSQAQDYLIYRSTHVESTFPFLDSTAVSNYTDVGVVGNTGTNYYYLFHTRHQDGGVYDKTSKAVGEFDIGVQNAK